VKKNWLICGIGRGLIPATSQPLLAWTHSCLLCTCALGSCVVCTNAICIRLVHITNPPLWMQGHVIVLRCSANDAEREFHFHGCKPGTTKLRGEGPSHNSFGRVEIWLDCDGNDDQPAVVHPSQAERRQQINYHWSIACRVVYYLPSKVTFYIF
jgi:hypothetical protein